MSLLRTEQWPNGDTYSYVNFYECDRCHKEFCDSAPHVTISDEMHLCWDCGYFRGEIDEQEFLSCSGICISNAHASIRDGEIVIWVGKCAPWKRTAQDIRKSVEYSKWRTAVFVRDEYTCQICGQVGGRLNAHHIKLFSKYPKLRLKVSNGLTLCESCHKEIHRKR